MITSLINKELRLSVNPWLYIFLAMALLLFIPTWVFFIALAYLFLFFMALGQMDKANQDLTFAISLPIPKSSIVTARTITVVIIEAAELVLAGLVSVARYWLYPDGNLQAMGMNTNLAFFGVMLMMYAVFNLVYLPGSYKRAYRMLWPLAGGSLIAVVIGGFLDYVLSLQPTLARIFNDRGFGHPWAQILLFAAGFVVYAGLTAVAWRKAVSNFAKVDL